VSIYLTLLRGADYRRLWTALVLNLLGDGATFTAMAWITVEQAGAAGLGILGVCYTLPVLLGGAVVGPLLDRFSRRHLMVWDSVVRGLVVAVVPVLAAFGMLQMWEVYALAAIYGLLKIIPLAGVPAILPEVVPEDQLQAAAGLESTAMGAANVAGPAIGAALISLIGAPNVLLIDAATYFAFAFLIMGIRAPLARPTRSTTDGAAAPRHGWSPVLGLIVRDRFLLFLTASFAAFNISAGALLVALPWLAKFEFVGGPAVLGLMLAVAAAAELIGSLIAGAIKTSAQQMVRIGVIQLLAGASLLLMLPESLPFVLAGLLLNSVLAGPMTVLGGVVRLTRVPNALRGRAMTLMRTTMAGALPLGSALGGFLLVDGNYATLIFFIAVLAAAPGLLTALSFRDTSFHLTVATDVQPASTPAAS
jgi:MFS family permease